VNVISHTADVHELGGKITADCGQISMHAGPHLGIRSRLAILRAKDNVQDDFA